MEQRAGSLFPYIRRTALCGCIGTFSPTQKNVAEEIIMNAISPAAKIGSLQLRTTNWTDLIFRWTY